MKHPILSPSRPLHFVLWTMIALILCAIFFAVDYWDGASDYDYIGPRTERFIFPPEEPRSHPDWREQRMVWAPGASGALLAVTAGYVFYVFPTVIVYHNAKRHGRNAMRWATAFVVFTPLLAGIAYLLSWPKGQQ